MKYIYLDQNKWIELARGIKDGNTKYIELYEKLEENVNKKEWAFPISIIHITESMKRKDKKSRDDILNLMFKLSGCYAICDYCSADRLEFESWVTTKKIDCLELKKYIIRKDWSNIIGLSSDETEVHSDNNEASPELITMIKDLIKKHSCDREVFDMICEIVGSEPNEEQAFYEDYVKGRSNFKKWKQDNEKIDNYKEKHLYPAYLIRVFYEEYGNRIKQLPTEKMYNLIEMSDESNKNKTKTIAYMESLPGFNIHNRLVFEIYNNPDKEVHKHDFNDLAYMRVAVPYCDMVIGENYWSDRVRHYGFDVKYNTVITTELFKLLEKQWSI